LTQCGANLNDSALFVASRAPGDDDQNHQQDCDDQDFQSASPPTMLAGRVAAKNGGSEAGYFRISVYVLTKIPAGMG